MDYDIQYVNYADKSTDGSAYRRWINTDRLTEILIGGETDSNKPYVPQTNAVVLLSAFRNRLKDPETVEEIMDVRRTHLSFD